jgi:hypothetical protein
LEQAKRGQLAALCFLHSNVPVGRVNAANWLASTGRNASCDAISGKPILTPTYSFSDQALV